jgi:uncharacterized protein YjaZ
MIIYGNKEILKLVEWLNKNFPTDKNVRLCLIEGYEVIESPNGTKCFGAYVQEDNCIYCGAEIEIEELKKVVIHEYKHFMDDLKGIELGTDRNEKDTEFWAQAVYGLYNLPPKEGVGGE